MTTSWKTSLGVLLLVLVVVGACFNARMEWSAAGGGGGGGDSDDAADGVTVTAISPASGHWRGGVPVTLTGTGFALGASVTIGGSSCTGVSVASDTQATCTTSRHTPTFRADVTLTNTDSTSGTFSQGYSLNYYAYFCNASNGLVYGFSIPETGPPVEVPGNPLGVSLNITTLAASPSGALLYVGGGSGGGRIKAATIASTGGLTLLPTDALASSAPLSFSFSPSSAFAYTTHPSITDKIDRFSFDGIGAPVVSDSDTFAAASPLHGVFHPTLQKYYVIFAAVRDVVVFSPNASTGELSLPTNPIDNAGNFRHLSISAANNLVFGTDDGGSLYAFTILGSGELDSTFPTPSGANLGADPKTAPNPAGDILYTTNGTLGGVSWFRVTKGVLSSDVSFATLGNLPFGSSVSNIAMHPTGKRLVVVDVGDKKFGAVDIDTSTGAVSNPQFATVAPISVGNAITIY